MLPENSTAPAKQTENRREYVSEAFHSFNQPLTALHCGLELSLLKERSSEEYRQRIEAALSNAGTMLQLSKAVRELVEATDPGEEFQKTELEPLLSSLTEELAVVAEAAIVALKMRCPKSVWVMADAGKLGRQMGNLAAIITRSLQPGGTVELNVEKEGARVVIAITGKGKQREVTDNLQSRLDGIRVDAACSYTWAVRGEFRKTRFGFAIQLKAL